MRDTLKTPLLAGGFSILFAFSPIFPALFAILVAKAFSCDLHEGFATPCVIAGIDFGRYLGAMAFAMWFLFFTVPIGAIGLFVSLVWLVVSLLKGINK